MNYSPFITKNIDNIKLFNYEIYPSGNQLYKKIGKHEILISDFSTKSLFCNYVGVINIIIWIKQSGTDLIIKEKKYSGNFFIPSLKKVEKYILKSLAEMK